VLWSAEGQSNSQIAERLGWTKTTVGKWRQRFLEHRLSGLYDDRIVQTVAVAKPIRTFTGTIAR